jgi:formylmethanofuran dehydrogenase subunit C
MLSAGNLNIEKWRIKMGSKSREDLYKLFKTGDKPTEDDFADLIDSMVNIAEDGIGVSGKGEPMELIQQGNNHRWLDLSSSKDSPVWRVNAQSAAGVNGLNVATADSASRLYIKREDGCVGIGNDAPEAQLHIVAASGTALQVDCGESQTALVIDAGGNMGIGTTGLDDYRLTVDGEVKLQGETTITGAVSAQNGLTVSGAALVARQGLSIQNGATVENGLLTAREGMTVTGKSLNANAGALVSGAALQAQNGLKVTNGAVIETGALEVKAGGVFSGAALVARDGLTATQGAVISGGRLEARAGASVTGGSFTAENGLTVANGAVIESGELVARQGITVNQGAVIESGELEACQGITVNQGAVIETGELMAQQGLTVKRGAVIETGELEACQGITVNQGAVIESGALEAKDGLTVTGATALYGPAVIETGLLTAKGGLTVTGGSVFSAEGQVTLGNSKSGNVASNGLFFAKQGLKVENAGLEAAAGAVVSGAQLLVEKGLTVSNGATFETGILTAKGGVTVDEGAALSATGPVTLGNVVNGMVTVNGQLQAANGAVISGGAGLVAANGLSVSGTLTAPDSAFLGSATIDSLSVNDINISGDLGLRDIALDSVTADTAAIGIMRVADYLEVAAPCVLMDSILIDTGRIYVSYEGPADLQPRLKVVAGPVAAGAGHFEIAVSDQQILTITYNEASKFRSLREDWQKYQAAQPDLTAGFKLVTLGDNYWETQDREVALTATATYREYIDTNTGLCVIYTVATDMAPQFTITANENSAVDSFQFEVADRYLTVKYPAAPENCTVNRLIGDWDSFISDGLENSGGFELRKTAGSSGNALVTARDSTAIEANPAGNVFYHATLKTNSVTIKGHLKFGDSDLEVSEVSADPALAANSDACLATQKAVRTYADNGLALKADKTAMAEELEQKADKTAMAEELAEKADKTAMAEELAEKADKTAMAEELEQKADKTAMAEELEQKADKSTMAEELEQKADKSTMAEELEQKADLSTVTEELAKKADQAVVLPVLAAKAGLIRVAEITIAAGATGSIAEITLTAGSRGLLMARTTTAAGIAGAGLFASHGTDSILKIAGEGMTTEANNVGTYNIYPVDGLIAVQNETMEDVTFSLSYFGG